MRLIDEEYTRHPFYGTRRMAVYLLNRGHNINRKRVQNLYARMGLEAVYPKPNLSRRNQEHKIFPYLLRGISIERVNQVWSADITYLRMKQGFVYLVAIIDWFSRYVLD
jgi:putative transposase